MMLQCGWPMIASLSELHCQLIVAFIFFSPSTCNWHYSCLAAMLLVDCHCELFVMSLPLQSPISAAISSPTCYDVVLPL